MADSTRQPGEYERLIKLYFNIIDKDLQFSKNKIGLICLIVRADESECVDIASNLEDETVVSALKHVLQMMTTRKRKNEHL